MRHLLGDDKFAVDRSVRRPAAHGEIIGCRDHRAAINTPAPKDEIGRRAVDKLTVFRIAPLPGQTTNFIKAVKIEQAFQPFPRI